MRPRQIATVRHSFAIAIAAMLASHSATTAANVTWSGGGTDDNWLWLFVAGSGRSTIPALSSPKESNPRGALGGHRPGPGFVR